MSERELVEYIAKALVEEPDEVSATDTGDGVIELRVSEEDRGKIIGRKGRTAHAIRTLLAATAKDGDPINLDIID